MMIARWQIDARFGHKQAVIDRLRDWASRVAPAAGLQPEKGKLLTGSIGALEATVEHNWEIADLAELERVWAKLGSLEAHQQWSNEMEPFVVSGTAKWNVYRVL